MEVITLLIVGNTRVGKSSLFNMFTDNVFIANTQTTIGVDFRSKSVDINGFKTRLEIWDTTGNKNFQDIVRNFYKKIHGIILMYDITDKSSFDDMKFWLKEVDKYSKVTTPVILVGNKIDLEDLRQVTYEDGEYLSNSLKFNFEEISVKNYTNIDELFSKLIKDIQNQMDKDIVKVSGEKKHKCSCLE